MVEQERARQPTQVASQSETVRRRIAENADSVIRDKLTHLALDNPMAVHRMELQAALPKESPKSTGYLPQTCRTAHKQSGRPALTVLKSFAESKADSAGSLQAPLETLALELWPNSASIRSEKKIRQTVTCLPRW